MTWFKIKEEKSTTPLKDEHFFALYYYPRRLVASRVYSSDEKATLQDIKKLFDFIVTEDQTRLAEVQQTKSPSAYAPITRGPSEESEAISTVAADSSEKSEAISIIAEPSEQLQAIPTKTASKKK
jgi:hypothetical protein